MQSWDDLRYLLALEQHGTLAKAAQSLNTNPTTVSRHIKRLSDSHKDTLVNMQRGGEWSLTEAGTRFANAARTLQDELEKLENDTTDTKLIKLTTVEFVASAFVMPNLQSLRAWDSEIELEIECQDSNLSLAYGEADIALRLGRPKSGRLIVSKLADIDMKVFSVGGQPKPDWIGLSREQDWLPEMVMATEFFGHPPRMRVESYACIRRMAAELDMAAIGPAVMFDGWNGLQEMEECPAKCSRELWSLHHERKKHDQRLTTVRNWIKHCVGQQNLLAAA